MNASRSGAWPRKFADVSDKDHGSRAERASKEVKLARLHPVLSAAARVCGCAAAHRLAVLAAVLLAISPLGAAVLDERDTTRLAAIDEALQSFEDDIVSAIHSVPRDDLEQLASYSYVKLNLEAAHERLNNIFMQVAVSIYMDLPADQALVLNVIRSQLLPPSRNYLIEKKDAIASMATAHPASEAFAAYSARASALLGGRAVPLLDELDQRIGATQR